MTTAIRFLTLPGAARALVVSTAALQLAARALLAIAGLPAAVRAAQWAARSLKAVDVEALAWALAVTAPRVGGTCLTQALAARALGGSNAGARLVLGTRPANGCPEFHAWAEIEGVTFPATADRASYSPLMVWD